MSAAPHPHVPRGQERHAIHTEVGMRRSGYRPFRVRVFDASPEGCKIEFIERPTVGERIWIKFDGVEGIESDVRWVDTHACGVHFNRSVHAAVFRRIVAIAAANAPIEADVIPMRPMRAEVMVDSEENAGLYSCCEWWLEGRTVDPGEHLHQDDHAYYVIEGTLSLHMNDEWLQLPKGSYTIVLGGRPHEFANESSERVGFMTFKLPSGLKEPGEAISPVRARRGSRGR